VEYDGSEGFAVERLLLAVERLTKAQLSVTTNNSRDNSSGSSLEEITPAQTVGLEKPPRGELIHYTFSPPPQSSPSTYFPAAGRDTTSGRCRNGRDSMLRFSKSSLRFSAAISLENLRKFDEI
jgi:hypothetical protein